MKSYYSKFFKKSKIRRKATLSALDLGEQFTFSALSNSRIISKLSAYSEWKASSNYHDRDISSLEAALAKDFIALVNQNLALSQKLGETNDLNDRIFDLQEQVRIFSREKANVMEEYRVLDSNYKFISLKNEQLSNYCANLQDQLCASSDGKIDLKEFRKSNELEFICHKLQKKIDDLEKENSELKVLGSTLACTKVQVEPSTNKPVNPSTQILTLRTNNTPFRVPKVEDDIYNPSVERDSSGSDGIEASAQTDMGFDVLKLEHAYCRLKKKNKELAKTLEIYKEKIPKDHSEISILGLNPNVLSRKKVGVNHSSVANCQTETKNVDPNLITLITEIENREKHLIKVKDEYRTLEEGLKKDILVRDQDIDTMRNEYQNMKRALEKEIEFRDQDLIKVRHEYQELFKSCGDSNLEELKEHLENVQSSLDVEKEKMISFAAEKDALKRRLDGCLKEISKLKENQKENWNMTMLTEGYQGDELSQKVSELGNQLELAKTQNAALENRLNTTINELNEQIMEREEHLSTIRSEYQDLSSSHDEIKLKNDQLAESLFKLQSELDTVIEKNKGLSAEKDGLEKLISVSQKEIVSLKHQNEDIKQSVPSDKLLQMQTENNDMIASLKKEITKYRLDSEDRKAEYQELYTKKESLLLEIKSLDQEVANRDSLISDLRNDSDKLQIDLGIELKALNTKILCAHDDTRILKEELDLSKCEYLKLIKEHEEALRFSSEKDLRIRETFSAIANLSSQLKSEKSRRVELLDELKVASDEKDIITDRAQSEYITLKSELKASEEKLVSLGIKYGELETEMKRKELEYKENIDEADSNFENLLQKYEDLGKKAVFLETLYKNAQSEFANTRRHIIR